MDSWNFLIPESLRALGLHILRPKVVAVVDKTIHTANSTAQAVMRLSAAICMTNRVAEVGIYD